MTNFSSPVWQHEDIHTIINEAIGIGHDMAHLKIETEEGDLLSIAEFEKPADADAFNQVMCWYLSIPDITGLLEQRET